MVNFQIWKTAKPNSQKIYIQLLKIAAINNQRISLIKRMLQSYRNKMLIEANKRVLIEDTTTDLIENSNGIASIYSEQAETSLIIDEMINTDEIYYICEEPLVELEHIYNSEVKIYLMEQANKYK